jgi:hypothetical protein
VTPVERAFVVDPPSEAIAAELNRSRADVCPHGRSPCYLRCGVKQDPRGYWHRIPAFERVRWLRAYVAGSTTSPATTEHPDRQQPLATPTFKQQTTRFCRALLHHFTPRPHSVTRSVSPDTRHPTP